MFSLTSRILVISIILGALGFTLFGWIYPSVPISEVLTVISLLAILLAYVIDYGWKYLQRNTKS
jgi:hypothetical protein